MRLGVRQTAVVLLLASVVACASKSAAPARAADAPVGTVIAVSGEVSYASAADTTPKPATVGLIVRRDMTFKTGAGASLDVRFDNNYVWKLAENRERAVASLAIVDRAPAPEIVMVPDEADPGDRTSAAGRHTEQTAAETEADQTRQKGEEGRMGKRPDDPPDPVAPPDPDKTSKGPPGHRSPDKPTREPRSDPGPPKGPVGCDEVECLLDPERACCKKSGSKPKSNPTGDGSALPETLSAADVKKGMAVVLPRIKACPTGGWTGTVKMKVTVAARGVPSSAQVIGEGVPKSLDKCIMSELSKLHFPPSQRGITFTYPIVYR